MSRKLPCHACLGPARTLLLVLCYLLASACSGPAVAPVSDGFADTLRESHVWYTAGIQDRGDTLDAVLVLTNPTGTEVRQLVSSFCTVLLVAHRTPERHGIPVWVDNERVLSDGSRVGVNDLCGGFDCVTLAPHGRQELIEPVPKRQMLEKLAPGEYHLSIRTGIADTLGYHERTLLLPAGSVVVRR